MSDEEIEVLAVLIVNIGIPLFFVILAMVVGMLIEKAHYRSIRARERATLEFPLLDIEFTEPGRLVREARLVHSSVAVSTDYFKRILAGFRNIFGGRVKSYETLLDRGRREALLRLKEQCLDADAIVNLRMETSTIGSTKGRRQRVSCIEVLAYGTAITYARQ